MQIGFLTAPFRKEPLEMVLGWASENGFSALEVVAGPGSNHIDPDQVLAGKAEEISKLFRNYNLAISSLAAYGNLLDPDPAQRKQLVAGFQRVIDAAQALRVEVVCTLAGSALPGKSKLQTIAEDFAQVFPPLVAYARERGVKIALENYFATLTQGLETWDKIFEVCPDPNLGLNFDPSHLYWMQVDYLAAVDRYGSRIFHTHAKDTEVRVHERSRVGVLGSGWWRYCIPGYGNIDWGAYIGRLKANGYDGVLSIEHEDGALGREQGFIKGRQYLAQFA